MDFNKRKIIAELGMTHDGSFGQAEAMIKAAAECGVDAVKLQTHISEAETIPPQGQGTSVRLLSEPQDR